jgi:lipopolysaccharide/colanic/teichoic acid biosynthesis glycosyltransferase
MRAKKTGNGNRPSGHPNGSSAGSSTVVVTQLDGIGSNQIFSEDTFRSMLAIERRRAERSSQPFVLMLLSPQGQNGSSGKILLRILGAVAGQTRETDLVGWHKEGEVLGIIFTQVSPDPCAVTEILRAKITAALRAGLGDEIARVVAMSVHIFPEQWNKSDSTWVADPKLYSDLERQIPRKRASLAVKRVMDIIGSAILLVLLAPILAMIALAIKLSSKGPVLFEQERMGQLAARFKCLKFRTMYTNCDAKIHQAYVQQFIAGIVAEQQGQSPEPIYKITNDPRITTFGRFLRKTSLDELPQLWNVLRGEMSLVGPRPPVPYEFEIYEHWHRRRVFEVMPGITGLWQVSGRSSTQFDDMVRLDLRYSQSWSLWLDIKILLATPGAVFSGTGAY